MMFKRISRIFLLILLIVCLAGCFDLKEEEGKNYSNKVNIFEINDTHGAFVTDESNYGFEKVNTILKELESPNNEYLKIANGDMFQGTYVSNINFGLPVLDSLNLMKFDAFVLGNHEFDWGLDKIAEYKDGNLSNGEANFPFLAANIVNKDTNKKLSWTDDYLITIKNGYKVGLIGVIGYGLESSIATEMVMNYKFLDPVGIVSDLALELRTEHDCDIVVVSIHGYDPKTNQEICALSNDSRIDAIVAGHSHQELKKEETRDDGYKVAIIQSATKNRSVGEIVIEMSEDKVALSSKTKHYYPSNYSDDKEMQDLIKKYKKDLDFANTVVTHTPNILTRDTIGNEITMAMKEKFGTNVSIMNTGGVRADIKVGEIKIKDIFEVLPFDNKIITTTLLGSKLLELYENQRAYSYFNTDFNFNSVDENKEYTVTTIDFVFTSPYYAKYFTNSTPKEEVILLRDVLIDYWS